MNKYRKLVNSINSEYSRLYKLSNDELRTRVFDIDKIINKSTNKNRVLDDYLVSVYSIVKETARRLSNGNIIVTANANDIKLSKIYDFVEIIEDKAIYKNQWDVLGIPTIWKMVHYDEQLLGGILLHYGYATEMATGEGKTLVATLPVFLNALSHDGVHVMTVNDYLSKRDFEATRPIYMFYGLTVDCIENYKRSDSRHKEAYRMDIVFGKNSSFIFDYLYDHIAVTPRECVQTIHNYAIIDELDSILIDEADEPHIVGGGNYYNNGNFFKENFPIIKELIEQKDIHLFEYDKLKRNAKFTQNGKKWLAERKKMPNLYDVEHTYDIADFDNLPHEKQYEVHEALWVQNVLLQILLAITVYERDVDYLVEGGKVKIIDPHTGRVKESSRWEFGLHTAMEVKENVKVQDDFDGMAVISLKNYFKIYSKIAGMSGTIMPVKDELMEIYNLKCASIPTHKPLIRIDKPLRIFKNSVAKDEAIIRTIIDNMSMGRPTLVGSITVKRSEEFCSKLDKLGIVYNKLDAKTLKDEAITISKAGLGKTITISTSVAGRGTDIKPSDDAINAGGLMVIGTDLFGSIRIDSQLKGRSGRQGNPGSSEFYVSLEDQILRHLTKNELQRLRKAAILLPGEEIHDDKVGRLFEKAQANCESYFKNCRKEIARKDDIIAPQRKKFYDQRNAVLFNADEANAIVNTIILQSNTTEEVINEHLRTLYLKTKELVIRSANNNINRTSIFVPFSDKLHTFAIHLDVEYTKESFEYFCKEFKRQIILQIYDKEWKIFVMYMMGNIDKKEIEMLDSKYLKMMDEIESIILSRLQCSTIPFDIRTKYLDNEPPQNIQQRYPRKIHSCINPEDDCPCGSGKKYCECHKSNIRSNNIVFRRR